MTLTYETDLHKIKAVFDLTESRFRFIVNPNLDSLANRMVWIRGVVGSDVIVIRLRL